MPLYGDPAHVLKMLRATPGWDLGTDVDDRLAAIQASVSLALEDKCGRTWGEPDAVDVSRLQWVGPYSMLVLDIPAISITSITTGGTVSGSTMTGGSVTAGADLANRLVDRDGLITAISYGDTGWDIYGDHNASLAARYPVVVTGRFGNADNDATVPADVEYAANYLMLHEFRQESASPAGFTGPDGAVMPIRNPWKDEQVTRVIDKYSLRKPWTVV